MSEKQKPKLWMRWLVVVLASLAAYVLSVGPFLWFMTKGGRPIPVGAGSTFKLIYSPVIWLAQQSHWLASAFEWYVRLWTK